MTSFAVVGPGRVGQALARRWVESGLCCVGFLGRRRESAAAAARSCGGGAVALDDWKALRAASIVLLSVPDPELAGVAAAAAAASAPRRCSLWLHASGFHDLAPLAPLPARGARIGSLHPLLPFPDAASGHARMPGKLAVLQGPPESLRLLRRLAQRAQLEPLSPFTGDRAAYHAACALAANGATAFADAVLDAFTRVLGPDGERAAWSLLDEALALARGRGPAAALTGPVARGEAGVVAAHVAALAAGDAGAASVAALYRAVMRRALAVAVRSGLDAERASRIAAVLDAGAPP